MDVFRPDPRSSATPPASADTGSPPLTDELTGLYNRRGFYLLAEQALRRRLPCSLLFADLDGIGRVNDAQGRAAGDALIARFGAVLHSSFRASDIVARLGGDEFCVLALDSAGPDPIDRRLARALSGALGAGLAVSFGVAHCADGERMTLDALIATADARMYERKRARRGLGGG